MYIFKKITLILSMACLVFPAHGMDADDGNQGFFGRLWNAAKEHPVIALSTAAVAGAGIWALRSYITKRIQLFDAVSGNAVDEVNELIRNGANINARNLDGWTLLHVAAHYNAADTAQVLIAAGADINAQDRTGNTPLHQAALRSSVAVVRMLVHAGARLEIGSNHSQNTPLHDAAYSGCVEAVQILLDAGAGVDVRNGHGCTPLHYAAAQGQVAVVRLLLARGACREVESRWRQTPLFVAARYGRTEVVQDLVYYVAESVHRNDEDLRNSQARINTSINGLRTHQIPENVIVKVVAFLPEDIYDAESLRYIKPEYSIDQLVALYPFAWFKELYDTLSEAKKERFLSKIVPAMVELRLSAIRRIVQAPCMLSLDPDSTDPMIMALLNHTSEQHRTAIEQNLCNAFKA